VQLKRIIIIGNKGFIGQSLEKRLQSNNQGIEVICRDLPELDLVNKTGIRETGDLFNMNTAVVMLSAIKRQFGDTPEAFAQNLMMTSSLSDILLKKPVGRFIYFSSTAVYGEDIHNTSITEETPVCPTSYYGMMKYVSERLFWKALSSQKESTMLTIRPATVYGPGDNGGTYGPVKFANAAVNKDELTIWGDGSELREFIFIDDVVDIACKLIFSSYDGELNLVSGTSYTFQEVLTIVENLSGYQICKNSKSRTKSKVDNVFINKRLIREIDPFSFTPLKEGVDILYKSMVAES